MNRRGQGAFEYVLLLAGVLLIVVLAIVLLRGGLGGSGSAEIQAGICRTALQSVPECWTAAGENTNALLTAAQAPAGCDAWCDASAGTTGGCVADQVSCTMAKAFS